MSKKKSRRNISFDNEADAKRYLEMHTKRLESFGYSDIKAKIFRVNEPLSSINFNKRELVKKIPFLSVNYRILLNKIFC